jgi:hypothetical protein
MKPFIAGISLLIALPLAAADDAASLHRAYDSPTLGAAKQVENVAFTNGHLKVTLGSGSAAPVKAGEETIGIFFKGKGQLEYTSDDPAEAAVLSTNARKATAMRPEKAGNGLVIRDSFDEVFLWAQGRDLPSLGEAAGSELSAAFTEHRTVIERERSPFTFPFIKQKLDAPTKPVVRAQFRGGKENLVYTYDSVDTKREELYVLQKDFNETRKEMKEVLWEVPLSSQPIGVSRKDFLEPPFILVNVDYTLTAGDKDAQLHVVETLIPRGGPQRAFRFQQERTTWDSNNKPHTHHVRKVALKDGTALSFVHSYEELLVSLPAAAPVDKPLELVFDIDGDFLIRPSGDSYWLLGTDAWFPQPESLTGQYYRVHSVVKVKKPWVPLVPGDTVRRAEEGDFNVVENRIDKPVQFAVAMAGKYSYEEETRNGLTIRVASYAGKNARATKELTNLAFTMIAFYQQFLGPFPFKEFDIIEINDFGYGQAPPATMFITQEAFNPTLRFENRFFSQGVNHRFAHELAHQWWGHVVKMGSPEEQWITESFAEVSAGLLMKQAKGDDILTPKWRSDANEASSSSSVATANMLGGVRDLETPFLMRMYLVYSKGAHLLASLHKELGDKQFLTFLRTVQGKYAWRHVNTKDVTAVLREVTGRDYGPWFDANYWGTGMPK